MSLPWIKKYLPNSNEIVGQDKAIKSLRDFIQDYKKQKKKALIIYGPSGTGKTSSVYAVGSEYDLEIIEINASDFRNKDKIQSIVGGASKQMSLFAKGKIILIDEIDGLSGTKDRGGIPALAQVIKNSSHPIILTALDAYDRKFSKIRKLCGVVAFAPLDHKDILSRLYFICDKESIEYEDMALKSLARRSGGDMRAAINDLQTLSTYKKLQRKDLEELSDRKQTESINDALLKIFKTKDAKIALGALNNVDFNFDDLMLWLDWNLPMEYKEPKDLARAYDAISKADVYRRRIKRRQHWRFLIYMNSLLSAGVATSKHKKNKNIIDYQQTKRILKMWMANNKFAKRKSIAQKIAEKTHISAKVALKDTLPYIKKMFENEKGMLIADELDLNDDEIVWLKK